MKQFIRNLLKNLFFYNIVIILIVTFACVGEEDGDVSVSPNPQQKMSEILDVLSGLSGKKSGNKLSKNATTNIKVEDLKTAIQVLQNKKDRDQVVKVLSALAYLQSENEKNQSLPGKFANFATSLIESTAELFLDGVKLLTTIPDFFKNVKESLSEEGYRTNLRDILLTIIVAASAGLLIEVIARLFMTKIQFNRPKNYTLYNLPQHIFRNSLPVILFGISAYIVVFYCPFVLGEALNSSFMLITMLIMVRIFLRVLRILFTSFSLKVTEKDRPSYISTYQFAVAIAQILLTGIIFAELGFILGTGDQIYQVWLKILSFGVTSLLILAVWKIRPWGLAKFHFEDENISSVTGVFVKIVQLVGNSWHWFVSLALILSFFLYFIGMSSHSFFVASSLVMTVILTAGFLWLRNLLRRGSHWLEKTTTEQNGLFMSLSSQPRIAFVSFMQLLIHVIYIILFLQIWGADLFGLISNKEIHPYLAAIISITLIISIIRLFWIWTNYIASTQVQTKIINGKKVEPSLFAKTIAPILQSVGHWVLAITAIILILEEIGIPIMPIIYGISVIGIAISLGAQSLVKDLINGILTLMEGNIAVGEVVIIGAHTGMVESLSLRGVSLRHGNGALQTIPFSEVTNIINKSRDYNVLPIELSIPYETDMGKVREVLQNAFNDITADPHYQRMIIDPITITGVDRFTDVGFVVTATIRIQPDPRNRFIRAFNQKLKIYLEKEKITPPSSNNIIISKEILSLGKS